MDFLIDYIERTGFEGRVFMTPCFRGSWGIGGQWPNEIVFHLLVKGTCHVGFSGSNAKHETQVMIPGDIVIIPGGDFHTLADSPDSKIMTNDELYSRSQVNPPELVYGDMGPETKFICGSFSLSTIGAELLLRSLPRYILIQSQEHSDPQLEQVIKMLSHEHLATRLGHNSVINSLLKILFICVLRQSTKHLSDGQTGLLRALEYEHLCRALNAIHTHFSADWDLYKLAAVSRVSRAKLANDFSTTVGQSPAKYLSLVRNSESEAMLRMTDLSIKEISHKVGFSRPEIFNRSFSRQFGATPTEYRKQALCKNEKNNNNPRNVRQSIADRGQSFSKGTAT